MFNVLDRLQITDIDHRYFKNYCYVRRVSGLQSRVQLEGRAVKESWIDNDQAVIVPELPQPILQLNLAVAAVRPRRRRVFPMIALFEEDNNELSSYAFYDVGTFSGSESVDFMIENTGSAPLYLAQWTVVS